MTDPAASEPIARWLAYGHPVWMVVALALCLLALRSGLSIRRARLARRPPPRGARAMHLQAAKPGVVLLLVGFAIGPLTVAFLRNWTPMTSFHALLGGFAVVLFVGAALQGARLERGEHSVRQVHAALAAAAVLLALATAIAGFALLP